MAEGSGQTTQSLRVVVVDDNEASAKTMGWTLELLGHEVKVVHNGPDAIAISEEFKPHIVMLDIGLPGMNGYEVCEAMRANPQYKDTVFIAQTGWGQEQHRKRSEKAGFNHHLVKPVYMETLEGLLASVKPDSAQHIAG